MDGAMHMHAHVSPIETSNRNQVSWLAPQAHELSWPYGLVETAEGWVPALAPLLMSDWAPFSSNHADSKAGMNTT